MPEYTISRGSRNLSVTWANQPVQRYNSSGQNYLEIDEPGTPRRDERGGLRSCFEELARAERINSGNDWRWSLFVNGEQVTAYWGTHLEYPDDYEEQCHQARLRGGIGYPAIKTTDCWLRADGMLSYGHILRILRLDGQTVRVRTQEAQ